MVSTSSSTVTREEISTIINSKLNHDNYNIVNYESKEIENNIGLLGNHVSLVIRVAFNNGEHKEFKFFAKFFPKHEGPSKFATETGVFAKEIFAYKMFKCIIDSGVSLLKDCTVNCHYTKDNHVIVMDDLRVENYVMEKNMIDNKSTIELIIRNLAKLHASSLIYEENQRKLSQQCFQIIDGNEDNLQESMYNDRKDFINIKGFEASVKGLLTEIDYYEFPQRLSSGKDFKETVKSLCKRIYELVKPSKKYRNVLTHGDLWSNNFLIKSNTSVPSSECKFVDFQFMRYVPPAQDLLNLLYLTTNRDFRKKYMYELIGYYYATMEKYMKLYGYNMNTIIPFSEFMDSCEEQKLCAIIITSTYFQLILVDGEFLEEFFADEALYFKTFTEDRSLLILSYVKRNEDYKERLKESVQDFRDYCESNC